MRVDRVAGSDPATRSADQLPVVRLYGEGLGRQVFPRQAGLQGEQDADEGIAIANARTSAIEGKDDVLAAKAESAPTGHQEEVLWPWRGPRK